MPTMMKTAKRTTTTGTKPTIGGKPKPKMEDPPVVDPPATEEVVDIVDDPSDEANIDNLRARYPRLVEEIERRAEERGKEMAGSETTTTEEPAPTAKSKGTPATLAELQADFPGESNASFIVAQLSKGATLLDAHRAHKTHRAERSARVEARAEAAQGAERPVSTGTRGAKSKAASTQEAEASMSAEDAWEAFPQLHNHVAFSERRGGFAAFKKFHAAEMARGGDWRDALNDVEED